MAPPPGSFMRRPLLLLATSTILCLLPTAQAFTFTGGMSSPSRFHPTTTRITTMRTAALMDSTSTTELPVQPVEVGPYVVRKATETDFRAIAETRKSVVILAPQARPEPGALGTLKVDYDTWRILAARIPGLISGADTSFIATRPSSSSSSSSASSSTSRQQQQQVVVGSADVTVSRPDRGPGLRLFLKNMWVDPSYRRQGVATNILSKVEDFARSQGVGCLELEVLVNNQGAVALYDKLGFSFDPNDLGGKICRALGVGRVTMIKQLS